MDDARRSEAAFAAMSDAVLAVASELSLEPVLRKLVEAARGLVGRGTRRSGCRTRTATGSRSSSPRG